MNLHLGVSEYTRMQRIILRNYNSAFNRRVTNIIELAEDMGVLSEVQCRRLLLDIYQVPRSEDDKYKITCEIVL